MRSFVTAFLRMTFHAGSDLIFIIVLLVFLTPVANARGDALEEAGPSDRSGRVQATITKARDELYQEWVDYQILGRAHSPSETRRIHELAKALMLLDAACAILGYERDKRFAVNASKLEKIEEALEAVSGN